MYILDLTIYILTIILIVLNVPIKKIFKNFLKNKDIKLICNEPSYVSAKSIEFIPENNNYKYNHVSQTKMNNLRNIKKDNKSIQSNISNFLEMPYDKYFKNIDISNLSHYDF